MASTSDKHQHTHGCVVIEQTDNVVTWKCVDGCTRGRIAKVERKPIIFRPSS